MSEKDEITGVFEGQEKEAELVFSAGAGSATVTISFADGARILPADVVAGLGGIEKIKEIAPALAESTYREFIEAYNLTKQRESLNNYAKKFIAGHFRRI